MLKNVIMMILIIFSVVFSENKNSVTENLSATFNSNYYSDNWDGNEKTSISWTILSNSLIKYNFNKYLQTTTKLLIQFGQIKERDSLSWDKFQISTDKIDLDAVFNYRKNNIYIKPYFAQQVVSKIFDNRDEEFVHYLNPFEFTESMGVLKKIEKDNKYSLSLRSGLAAKQQYDRYKLDEMTNVRDSYFSNTNGFEFVADYFLSLRDGVIKFNSTLNIFKGLQRSDADKLLNENWKSADIDFENVLQVNITKYIMAKIYVELLYDKEIVDELRIQQNSAVGLTLNF